MKFTKMHGIGNDYIYVNGFEETVADPESLSRAIADRHFGVGSDGLILVLPSDSADVRMRMFNADGSEGEMCGNGIRCVAKFAYDRGIARTNPMRIETGRGVLTLDLVTGPDGRVSSVTVNMGRPVFESAAIPLNVGPAGPARVVDAVAETLTTWKIAPGEFGPSGWDGKITGINTGNPHAIFYVRDVAAVPLELVGRRIENLPLFPKRANVHVVQVDSPDRVTMRTWERGSGITLACGTGASAVCVAGAITGRSARRITAKLPGGELSLEWKEADDNIYMTGPAAEIFDGVWR